MPTPSPSRVHFLDVLKSYAILLVLLTHVASEVFNGYGHFPFSTWTVFNLISSAVRVCVPLFVMVSGALMLGSRREEPPIAYLRRRLPGILLPFAVWSVIYVFVNSGYQGVPARTPHTFVRLLVEPAEYHLWFMYMMIGLFIAAPFLKAFVRGATPADLSYICVVWMLLLVLQYAVPAWDNPGPTGSVVCYGGYFVLGYVLLRRDVSASKARVLGLLSLAIILASAWEAGRLFAAGTDPQEHVYGYVYPLVAANAMAQFLFMKTVRWDEILLARPRAARLLRAFSSETFNLYLLHPFLLTLLAQGRFGFTLTARSGGTPFIGVPVTFLVVLLGTFGLAELLKRLPIVSRFLVLPTDR